MIWHIFKKDWKLLWPLVGAAAFVNAVGAMLWWVRDHAGYDVLQGLAQVFPIAALLAWAIVSIAVVQNDPIPGDREDWLARPIRRSELLAAKLLFIVLAVAGPILLVSIGDGLLYGFSLVASTEVSVGRSSALLVQICLPAMLLGAMTRNLVEALLGALIAVVAGTAQVMSFLLAGIFPTLNNSGLSWWFPAILSTSVVGAALIILPMQYFRRANGMSRLVVIPFFLLALSGQYWPWNWVFLNQQWLASGGDASSKIAIGFDPNRPRSLRTAIGAGIIGTGHAALVNLPIRADGVPAGDVLLVDRAEIWLRAEGKVIYHQESAENSYSISAFTNAQTRLRQDGSSDKPLEGYQTILLPPSVLNRLRSQDLTLEIDYSLSLIRKDAAGAIRAQDDGKHLEKIGWCHTGVDDDGDEITARCVQLGRAPNCLSAILENPATGQRDPERFACAPDYRPIPIKPLPYLILDDLERFGLSVPFAGNAAKYPIGESQLPHAQVMLTSYQPAGHFTRHLTIPKIRLGDWEAQTGQITANTASE